MPKQVPYTLFGFPVYTQAGKTVTIPVKLYCELVGHDLAPLYIEEDGHVDDHICRRCCELV
jgi:hypothetical protein